LKSVPGDITRPITDRVKEALFNILGADIQEAVLLDVFAGTGSVGIEALSRGAAHIHFNDRHHLAVRTIRENLEITGFGDRAEISKMDAFRLLEGEPDRKYDYIFIAPPQYQGIWVQALRSLDRNPAWLKEDTWVVVQIHPLEYESVNLTHLLEFDRRKYGSTMLVFYEAQ
jgi:16S rRNA (guanine(966)-N(2))-methyltransferase RsmD